MNHLQVSNKREGLLSKRLCAAIMGVSLLVGCVKDAPPVSGSHGAESDVQALEGTQVHKPLKLPIQRKRSQPQCRVDITGLVKKSVDPRRLEKVRRQAWAREQGLILNPDWLALLPSLDQIPNSKVVSFEISAGALGGHLKPGMECVRWRLLSRDDVTKAKADMLRAFTLSLTPRGTFFGPIDLGTLEVNVGTNGQSVTQLDFALVPRTSLPPQITFGEQSPTLMWLRSHPVKAFEYGLYVSGRRGLKFPGLERVVLVADIQHEQLESKLKSAQFSSDSKDKRVYVNEGRTVTARSYNAGFLSVFWQSRLNAQATASKIKTRP